MIRKGVTFDTYRKTLKLKKQINLEDDFILTESTSLNRQINSTMTRDAEISKNKEPLDFDINQQSVFNINHQTKTTAKSNEHPIDIMKNSISSKVFETNSDILDEIYQTNYEIYATQIDNLIKEELKYNWKAEVNLRISKKSQSINRHFKNLKDDIVNKNLSEEDKEDFKDYDIYFKQIQLFNELDVKIQKIRLAEDRLKFSSQTTNSSEMPVSSFKRNCQVLFSSSSNSDSDSSSNSNRGLSIERNNREISEIDTFTESKSDTDQSEQKKLVKKYSKK